MLDQLPQLANMQHAHIYHQMPHPPAPKSVWWKEVLKFLGLFAFFFVLLAVIVMGPTIYTTVTYWFSNGGKDYSNQYNLPSSGDSFANVDDLVSFVDNAEAPRQDSIVIPKINVDAPLVFIQDYSNNAILEAIKNGVGHYPGTALPGRIGNSFLTGHSSYYWWSGGEYNQIFALLHNLEPGDLIYVYYQGDKFIYKMSDSEVVSPTDVHVLDQTTTPTLSLMTCTPIGTNLRRLIVKAELIGSPPVSGDDFKDFIELPDLPSILPLY